MIAKLFNCTRYPIKLYSQDAFEDLTFDHERDYGIFFTASGIASGYFFDVLCSVANYSITYELVATGESVDNIPKFSPTNVHEHGLPEELMNKKDVGFIVSKDMFTRAKLLQTPNSHRLLTTSIIVLNAKNKRECLGHAGIIEIPV
ncbi:hypothetical protein [Moorena sp. SIO3A2]|uniref:hypothetical protein n=1 Tax=Moorena sp. SIO3A2 TaxID=2607841 RepID=UPI0013BA331A|nr:hypothetical protein [Moorena sp. SIO3A2]NER90380.1 hypothetical protein [Moorena sp. SIO3A2]